MMTGTLSIKSVMYSVMSTLTFTQPSIVMNRNNNNRMATIMSVTMTTPERVRSRSHTSISCSETRTIPISPSTCSSSSSSSSMLQNTNNHHLDGRIEPAGSKIQTTVTSIIMNNDKLLPCCSSNNYTMMLSSSSSLSRTHFPSNIHHSGRRRRYYSRSTRSPYKDGVTDADTTTTTTTSSVPGARAFVDCDRLALVDLFDQHATILLDQFSSLEDAAPRKALNRKGLQDVLVAVGENPDERTLNRIFDRADLDGNGVIDLDEFLASSDDILGQAPAGIVLLVGGPGSGKGVLSKRLEKECGVVHLSSGDLLRNEVQRGTVLGQQVREVMARGELVSSAVIVTLIRRVMRDHAPHKRVLLDGFPRSAQNAHDLVELCGVPELALHLQCDDTILMERILKRKEQADDSGTSGRDDDNIHTALTRLRSYHKYQTTTMDWLREQHIPVVNLDCSGTPDQVWQQLLAIGRLMRPVTWIGDKGSATVRSGGSGGGMSAILGSDIDNHSVNVAATRNGKAEQG